ncbi:MAG: S9 family peptidase [Polyangiales bacterium]
MLRSRFPRVSRARWVFTSALLALLACRSQPPPASSAPSAPGTTAAVAAAGAAPKPPVPARREHAVHSPHGDRDDPYYWLRDDTRTSPEVRAHLEAENVYTAAVMAPVADDEQQLAAELRRRVQEDDRTVPELEDGYWYYTRFEAGKQQPIHARKRGSLDAPEEILLDGNQLAQGHAFYKIGAYRVSRDGRTLAWADDAVGRNQYTLHLKDLQTGALLADTAANIAPNLAWANDGRTLFYVGQDEVTLRADRVFRHVRGGASTLVHHEPDGQYYTGIGHSKSKQYVLLALWSTTNTEYRLIDADHPERAPRVFLPRAPDHLYDLDHLGDRFVMRTNRDAQNFRLVSLARPGQTDARTWKPILAHDPAVLIESFALYDDFIAVSLRRGGLERVRVLPEGAAPYELTAPEAPATMGVIDTPEPSGTRVRYQYDSMTTPTSVYEADVRTRAATLLKEQPVPSYDKTAYESAYVHARAADGVEVPVSLVWKRGTKRDGTAPLLLYGYGSYGASIDPWFNQVMVSLLDRGWVYAIAHVRGGEELGRGWYEDGKLMKKKNTFTDFIAVSEHLVAESWAARDRLFALGRSAGGLLMGAVLNMRPDLYRGVVAGVPFVDVVTTMLDASLPLTTNEYDEWGNPEGRAAYDYMLSYSPYDNVAPTAYPWIFVHTGLHDSQVQYFEPAKWVAKLRHVQRGENPVLFYTDLDSGHGGASGRFDRLRQDARTLAFLLLADRMPDRRRQNAP